MATGEPSPPTDRPTPFQFTLRQLLAAMTVVCIGATSIYWLDPIRAFLAIALLIVLVTAFYYGTKRQYTTAEFAIIFGIIIVISTFLTPSGARVNYRWAACQNNMRNIALALQNYHDIHGCFPPAYIADADGKPMHSWRVLILPYLEQQNLYNKYCFDEPWDGPTNSLLHGERVHLFECPSDTHARTDTSYLAVTGPQTIWPGATSTKMSDIKDGTANTILLVEVHNSGIHWMEPRDLEFSKMPMAVNSPTGLSISSEHPGGFANIIFADGHPQRIPNSTPAKSLRAALTISGGGKTTLPAVRERR